MRITFHCFASAAASKEAQSAALHFTLWSITVSCSIIITAFAFFDQPCIVASMCIAEACRVCPPSRPSRSFPSITNKLHTSTSSPRIKTTLSKISSGNGTSHPSRTQSQYTLSTRRAISSETWLQTSGLSPRIVAGVMPLGQFK